jgi:hypothetical protein
VYWLTRMPKAIKEAIKSDYRLRLQLALCKELHMTLTQLRNNATPDDLILHAAYLEVLADETPSADAAPTQAARRSRRR